MRVLGVAFLVAVAGCAAGVPVERQVVVPGGRFDSVRGEAAFFVRTFVEGEERREVVGAKCYLISSLYTAELITPSRVVVPNFGPQSPELTLNCAAGDLAGSGQTRIVTYWREPPGFWGPPGFYSPFYQPFGWGWYGPAYPDFDYLDVKVVMH